MDVFQRLASSMGRRDEAPNQELAAEIAAKNDRQAVNALVSGLAQKSAIVSDCIKTLYEIGYLKPELIAPHTEVFLGLLQHKNNRLQWGAMTALDSITPIKPDLIYAALPQILDAANKGSVITKDHAVGILIHLCAVPRYAEAAFALLNEQLLMSLTNQLPAYAERATAIVNDANRDIFVATLTKRLPDIDKESKRKRVEKVIGRVSKKK